MKKKEGGQKMKRKTLEGHDAVEYARNNNLLLKKWADPTEPYRDELPVAEAEAVCLEDPGLIFIEIERSNTNTQGKMSGPNKRP